MIPEYLITEWRKRHPWPFQYQVEHDLLLCRVLVELFSNPYLAQSLAFRGGTALYKLFLTPAPRYSEDIDLVQVSSNPIGETIDQIRTILDPLLGIPRRKLGRGMTTITYRYLSEDKPSINLRLKLEINTREHYSLMGYIKKTFSISSSWFSGEAKILTYQLEELMGTKLRALYQRNKGRDLFDLWFTMNRYNLNLSRVLKVCNYYLQQENLSISRAEFEKNLYEKRSSGIFHDDILPLLRSEEPVNWNPTAAFSMVQNQIIAKMPGEKWKGHSPTELDFSS